MNESDEQSNGFDRIKKLGFELFTNGSVRRLTTNIFTVKSRSEGSYVIENKEGHWTCDCPGHNQENEFCEHIYASQLNRSSNKKWDKEIEPFSESSLKCRFCGSPDLRRAGFRFGVRGLKRRYFCNECERKFSIRIVESQQEINNIPKEVVWLLGEVGIQVSRLNELLMRLDSKLTRYLANEQIGNPH